ncbi:MAG: hypothetical protein LUF25_02465 [Phascolarctobacterium sp.]|nr:hypothetical protein [Phascolarctobacterium sp.]
MFYYVFNDTSGILPILIMFFFLCFIVTRVLSTPGRKRRQPDRRLPGKKERQHDEDPARKVPAGYDLAAEFERKLRNKQHTQEKGEKPRLTGGKIYTEKQSANEKIAAGFDFTAVHSAPERKEKKSFAHPDLVNGFVMAKILEKSLSIRPYDEGLF